MSGSIQVLWAQCPRMSRLLTVAYPVVSLALLLGAGALPALQMAFPPCSVYTVIGRGLLWAMPLSFLYRPLQFGPALLFLFIELYIALSLLPTRERTLGSSTFAMWLVITTCVTNMVFLATTYALGHAFGPAYMLMPIQGLWPLVMVCITLRSMMKPDETVDFWGVVQFPNKWYPVILAALLTLLNSSVMWDIIAALVVGYGHERLRVEKLAARAGGLVASLERRLCRCCRRAGEGVGGSVGGQWIPAGGAPMPGGDVESGASGASGGSVFRSGGGAGVRPQQREQRQAPNFRMFQGSGQRLGSS